MPAAATPAQDQPSATAPRARPRENREWPGNENGVTAPSRHAALLFNRLLRPNADAAVDFHTGTTGFDVSAFNIAGMDVHEIKAIVELYPVGQIFDNHVYPGVLHNAFVDVGM